ncbi:MAG: DUF433 domain-containing protein [Chloroflexi bacterium]|nr:DUF433 domain-containing protein [Chloroflexota bacterium]
METPRISVSPDILGGRPCVAGTRIPVYAVLELVEAGMSFDIISREYYPSLTPEDVQACIHYATQLIKNEEVHLLQA